MSYITIPAHLVFSQVVPAKYRGIRILLEALSLQDLTLDEKAELLKIPVRTLKRTIKELQELDAYPAWPDNLRKLKPDPKYVPRDAKADFSNRRRRGGWFTQVDRIRLAEMTPVGALIYCILRHKQLPYWTYDSKPKSSLTELAKILKTDKRTVKKHLAVLEDSGLLVWGGGQFEIPTVPEPVINQPWDRRRELMLSAQDRLDLYRQGFTWYDLRRDEEMVKKYLTAEEAAREIHQMTGQFGRRLETDTSGRTVAYWAKVGGPNMRLALYGEDDEEDYLPGSDKLESAIYSQSTPHPSAIYSPLSGPYIRLITPAIRRGYEPTSPTKRRGNKDQRNKGQRASPSLQLKRRKAITAGYIPGYITGQFIEDCLSCDQTAEHLAVWFMSAVRRRGNDLQVAAEKNDPAIFSELTNRGRALARAFIRLIPDGADVRDTVRAAVHCVTDRCRYECKIEYAVRLLNDEFLSSMIREVVMPSGEEEGPWFDHARTIMLMDRFDRHQRGFAAFSLTASNIAESHVPKFAALPEKHKFLQELFGRTYKWSCFAATSWDDARKYDKLLKSALPGMASREVAEYAREAMRTRFKRSKEG